MGKPEYSELSDGRLSVELAERLVPELQDALDHPLRREILRNLGGSDRAWTPVELAPRLGSFGLSQVSYHVQVLAGDGAVIAVGESRLGGRSYAADLSREREVVEVLQATQRCDQERLRLKASGGAECPPPETAR